MAIQAQMYPDNLGLPLMGGSQDWLFMSNNNQNIFNNLNNTNNNNINNMGFNEFSCSNNLQQQKQQQFQYQQQQQLLLQQQQYLIQLQNQQQKNTSCETYNDAFGFLSSSKNNCTSTTTASTTTTTTGSDFQMPVDFSSCFADQFEKQRQEIDRFITLQNERLKLALQEQRKQQLSTLMRKLEAKAMQLLTQKDDEIAKATKRTIELEDIITKMEIENQEWQRLATENEAMVVSLNNTLEQLNKQACCITLSSSCSSNEWDQDAESCCNVVNNEQVFNNNKGKQETSVAQTSVVLCKVCKSRKSCILLLPCRHLCCCKGCEPFIDACPVCKSSRMASIEALIS